VVIWAVGKHNHPSRGAELTLEMETKVEVETEAELETERKMTTNTSKAGWSGSVGLLAYRLLSRWHTSTECRQTRNTKLCL
jgi:hypothetical protein